LPIWWEKSLNISFSQKGLLINFFLSNSCVSVSITCHCLTLSTSVFLLCLTQK
jgi:hypothetical protein